MPFEVNIIKALQTLSSPFFDGVNLVLTQLGDEMFFIVVAVIIYWCFNKRFGFKLINVYLLSASLNEGLKAIFGRVRPYKLSGIRSIGPETEGFAFPSGHSQSISNISTQLVIKLKKYRKPLIIGLSILTVLVMFTRMYLGQHYLTDVLVGCALGIGTAVAFGILFDLLKDKEQLIVIGVVPICFVLLMVMIFVPGIAAANVLKVAGGYSAVAIGYFIEKKYVKYEVKSGALWKQLIKILLGLGVALALKEGLKMLMPADWIIMQCFVRYFILGIWASLFAMMIFKAVKL